MYDCNKNSEVQFNSRPPAYNSKIISLLPNMRLSRLSVHSILLQVHT